MAKESGQDFEEILRTAIKESGLSQNELARRAGVSQAQVGRFLHAERTLSIPSFNRLCTVLGLKLVRE